MNLITGILVISLSSMAIIYSDKTSENITTPNYSIKGNTLTIKDTIAFIKEFETYKAADHVLSFMNVDGTITNKFLFNKAVNKYRKLRSLNK